MRITCKEDLDDWVYNAPIGTPCYLCGSTSYYNGTGGSNTPVARWFLKKFIWDKAIQPAVLVHDRRFHIGEHTFNLSFEESNEEFGDLVEKCMIEFINKKWYRRWMLRYAYNWIDEIYEYAVGTDSGREAWEAKACIR